MDSQSSRATSPSKTNQKMSSWLILALVIVVLTTSILLFIHFTEDSASIENTASAENEQDCTYKNKTYKNGESFGADDGCNLCKCVDGDLECTQLPCEKETVTTNSYFGYVQNFYTEDEVNYISFKTAEFITSEQEDLWEEKCGSDENECPNGYYIDESNSELFDFQVDEYTKILVISDEQNDCALESDETGKFINYELDYSEFKDSPCNFEDTVPFQLETEHTKATEITQVFVP